MLRTLLKFILLPAEISPFERKYLAKVNRITVQFFLLHIPVFALIAWVNDTQPLLALFLTSAVAAGPIVAFRGLENPRTVGLVYGFTSMLMGGLLVHFGQGPVQIEMHFYFFALLAMLALYGNPSAILVAAVTVAVHHLLLWMLLPSSVFNYDAPWWVVAVHAAFVVLESIATVYIARSFFDNVIGLEKVVLKRTAELDARNRSMRLVLDNVAQGLVSIDRDGVLQPEHSAAIARWFGEPKSGQTIGELLADINPLLAEKFALAWEQCLEGLLPLDLCLDQAPSHFEHDDRHYTIAYQPLLHGDDIEGLLIIIADETAELERQRLQKEQQEMGTVIERALADRAGFVEFMDEVNDLMAVVVDPDASTEVLKRSLHTIKGNCMTFGVRTVADACHEIESYMVAQGDEEGPPKQLRELDNMWHAFGDRMLRLLGELSHRIEMQPDEYQGLLRASMASRSHQEITQMLVDLRLEPTAIRLERIAAQAERIAQRLDKGGLQVKVEGETLRLDPRQWASFWSAFIHVVRNAVDHGVESPDTRRELGKPEQGSLTLRTSIHEGEFVISATDDGAGIDWDQVAARAEAAGLPHATEEELLAALLTDGITTAANVSEYSGRGIGLAAAHKACQDRNGRIKVETKSGCGTTLSFHFPLDSMAPQAAELVESIGSNESGLVASRACATAGP